LREVIFTPTNNNNNPQNLANRIRHKTVSHETEKQPNEVVCDVARRSLNSKRNGQPKADGQDEETPAAQAAPTLVK
jgi:hypothetical protein